MGERRQTKKKKGKDLDRSIAGEVEQRMKEAMMIKAHFFPSSLLHATATAMFEPAPTVTGMHNIVDGSKSTFKKILISNTITKLYTTLLSVFRFNSPLMMSVDGSNRASF